jgi:hypothetical protein
VLLQYEVTFPSRFPWALGGALPGLYCASGLRVSFCWREGGPSGDAIAKSVAQDMSMFKTKNILFPNSCFYVPDTLE